MAANNVWIIHFNVEVVDPVTKEKSKVFKVRDVDGNYTEAEIRDYISKNFPNAKITKIEAPGKPSSSPDAVKPPVKPTEKPAEKPTAKPPVKPPETVNPAVTNPNANPGSIDSIKQPDGSYKVDISGTNKDAPKPPNEAPPDSAINDIVKKKEEERIAKEVEAARERVRQKAEQERLEKERAEKERQQNQPAPVTPPKKEEPPAPAPAPAPAKKDEPPAPAPAPVTPAKKDEPPAPTPAPAPSKTKEEKLAEVEARLQALEKSEDPKAREQAARIRKKLGGSGAQETDKTPTATTPSKVPTPSDQIGGTSDKPSTTTAPGKTGDQTGTNQGPGKTSGDGNKPGTGTGNKADGGKGKDGQGDKGPGTGTSGQGYWKDIGDSMVMWKGAPGTDSTFPGQNFKDGDIMPNPKYTVPTGGKGDDKYSSNNAEELRRQNRLKDEEIRKLKLRAGIK